MGRLFLLTCLAALLALGSTARGAERSPNVLLILTDDQGTLDLGVYGSADLKTPHLDALAQRGVRFTQAYTASPVCSPSRAALLTGRVPQRARMTTNAPSQPGLAGMPADEVTLAEVLKGAGYRTGLVGKWHLGTTPETDPLGQGFDRFFGHWSGCIDNYSHFFYWSGPHWHDLHRQREEVHEDGVHSTELWVREAKRFLREGKERPFFLYLALNTPHYPLQAPERFRRMYRHLPEPRRAYAASVSHADWAVGEVLSELERSGQRENTLVVFLSDHGHSTEERANFGGGNAGPYRGAKFSLLEGGIRIPCIAALPGRIPAGETREQMVASVDWFPTIAELCGAPLPRRTLDGRSLATVLRSPSAASPHPAFHWQLGDQWAVREGDWKLVVNGRGTRVDERLTGADRELLIHLPEDAAERRNRAAEQPERVARFRLLHEKWASTAARP